jgi:hypothetical protein
LSPAARLFATAFLGLWACSCSAAPEPSLVGFWLGEGQPDVAGRIVYITEIKNDGTFRSEFRKYEGCRLAETNIETGTWTLNGDVEEMITTEVNGSPVNFGNVYTIELLNETEQRARMHKNNYLFVEKRVAGFQFPPCQGGA